jgi:hypothetical protein
MVLVYNSTSVTSMDEETKQKIEAAGVPLSIYINNFVDLGPSNRSALQRFANVCTAISLNNLPLPPSPFVEFVVKRTTGKSKQDFTGMIDGKKGKGKSYSSSYILARYAIEAAKVLGWDPKDYFGIENCALLEDTEGITKLLNEADKYQGILIDDASTAIGSRDFATQKSKNINKIITVCRTKWWFVMLNAPLSSHVDKQERELMDMIAHIYKPFHKAGFNVLKINSSESTFKFGKPQTFEKRFSFFDRKFDFWCCYSPDILDPFKGFTQKYDKQREEAANKLISDITTQEKSRTNPENKQEKKRRLAIEKHGDTIIRMSGEGASARQITAATGLTDHMINIIKSELNVR